MENGPKSLDTVLDRSGAGASGLLWPGPQLGSIGLMCGLPFCCVLPLFHLHFTFVGPILALFERLCRTGSETKKWPYLRLDVPDHDSEGALSLYNPPLFWLFAPHGLGLGLVCVQHILCMCRPTRYQTCLSVIEMVFNPSERTVRLGFWPVVTHFASFWPKFWPNLATALS